MYNTVRTIQVLTLLDISGKGQTGTLIIHKELSYAAKSHQSCLTLCDPIPGILQARTLEWVATSFSNA